MADDDGPFPLDVWFDLSAPIPPRAVWFVEDVMALHADQAGEPPYAPSWQHSVRRLRQAVRAHNARFGM